MATRAADDATGAAPPPEGTSGPSAASAPGKVILLGEHAVVYGQPALSVSLSLRTWVEARVLPRGPATVDGRPMDRRRHAYLMHAVGLAGETRPVALRTRSEVPPASGMGSSAALSVAAAAATLRLRAPPERAEVARVAFEAEYAAQGRASPNDTSVSTAGGAVVLAPAPLARAGTEPLWRIEKGDRAWHVHRLAAPPLPLVVGFTGVRARTGDQVWAVRKFVETNPRGPALVAECGRLVLDAMDALRGPDLSLLGALMNRNHALLNDLGVGHPMLERLVLAARAVPGTYGAKTTGAGGGGSMVALCERPLDVAAALDAAGGKAYIVSATPRGVEFDAGGDAP